MTIFSHDYNIYISSSVPGADPECCNSGAKRLREHTDEQRVSMVAGRNVAEV